MAGSPVPVVVGNVRWLSGYRLPRHDLPNVAAALQAAFAALTGLMAGAESVGDPIAVGGNADHVRIEVEQHQQSLSSHDSYPTRDPVVAVHQRPT